MSVNNQSNDDSPPTAVVDQNAIVEEDLYTANDANENTKLIKDDMQFRKSYNEQIASSSSQGSTSGKNRFGMSTSRSCPTCNGTGKVKKSKPQFELKSKLITSYS